LGETKKEKVKALLLSSSNSGGLFRLCADEQKSTAGTEGDIPEMGRKTRKRVQEGRKQDNKAVDAIRMTKNGGRGVSTEKRERELFFVGVNR